MGTLGKQNDGINFNSNNVWCSKIVEKNSNNKFNPIVSIAQVSVYYWKQVRRLSSSFNKHYTPFTEQFLGLLVHPKGNQSWMFIEKTNVEAEIPTLWPPDEKNWLIGKDPDAGKDWGQEEKGTTEEETVGWLHWLNGHEFE